MHFHNSFKEFLKSFDKTDLYAFKLMSYIFRSTGVLGDMYVG